MTDKRLQDKCRGALIGGAVGDALGYAVEFSTLDRIRKRYGATGITAYDVADGGVAEISDDTQMSLFTAEGLLAAIEGGATTMCDIVQRIRTAYTHWYATQTRSPHAIEGSPLSHVAELWAARAPGNTCLTALRQIASGNGAPVVNNSKGCGGVMRVAPVGIYSAAHPGVFDLFQTGTLAGLAAEITHRHKLSTYSSMALAMIVEECIATDNIDRDRFHEIVTDRVFKTMAENVKADRHLTALLDLVLKAMRLAESDAADTDAIRTLGEGWVAEETLAIAVFSVMRYIDNFEKCMICSVNHSGDSDSTGAVAGNIAGAIAGYDAIPEKFKTKLELHDLLVSVADELGGFRAR